jgi:hypothetical protein
MINDNGVFFASFAIFAPQAFMVWRIWRSDQSLRNEMTEQPRLIVALRTARGPRVRA